jgi:aspartate kinase
MPKIVVKKFGGTSVGDTSRIQKVAELIANYKDKNPDTAIIAVVSAMAGETNRLIALAKSAVAIPQRRELDVLITTGEQQTCALLAMCLKEKGVEARSLLAGQAHITTDSNFTNATIEGIDTCSLTELVDQNIIPVVAGFQGVDCRGNLTTLGRGGSDITAVALAAALSADACYIYTDVDGVYSSDPRICKSARRFKQLCHEEMLEMASLGAKVLHPRSVYFAMRYKVKLAVLSTFNPETGATWIVSEDELMEKPIISGITYRNDEAQINVSEISDANSLLSKLFTSMEERRIFVDMISHLQTTQEKDAISFTVPEESLEYALEMVKKVIESDKKISIYSDSDVSKISVVGIGMRYHTGVAAKIFRVLETEKIPILLIGTSEIKISLLVPRKYSELAVRVLHQTFIEEQPEIKQET